MILDFKTYHEGMHQYVHAYTIETLNHVSFEDKGGEVDVVEHRGPGEYVIIGHVSQYNTVDIRY